MSLINRMLSDLEARRAGVRVTEDLVLGDLAAASGADLRPAARRAGVGATFASLMLGVALTVAALHLAGLLAPLPSLVPATRADASPAAWLEPVTVLPAPPPEAAGEARRAGRRETPGVDDDLDEADLAEAQAHVARAARGLDEFAAAMPVRTGGNAPPAMTGTAAAGAQASIDGLLAPAGTLSIRRVEDAQVAPDLQAATRMARAGRYDQALPIIRRLVGQSPDATAPHLTLVATLAAAGRADEMKIALAGAAARLPAEHRIAMPYARMLVDDGHEAAALAALEAALPAARDDADYQAFAAALAQRLERHAQAVALYRAALALRGGNGVWWMGLGISLAALDEADDARAAFRRALADPGLASNLRSFVAERLAQVPGGRG